MRRLRTGSAVVIAVALEAAGASVAAAATVTDATKVTASPPVARERVGGSVAVSADDTIARRR